MYSAEPTMGLIRIWLLLFVTGMDTIIVQSTFILKLKEGESAHIQCCLNLTESPPKPPQINWLKNNNKTDYQSKKGTGTCPILVIENVQTKDSGLYVCEVKFDIPILRTEYGTGTQLTVTPHKSQDNHQQSNIKAGGTVKEDVIVFILRCLPFVTLLMAAFYLSRDGKKGKSKVQQVKHTPTHVQEEAVEENKGPGDEADSLLSSMERGPCSEEEGPSTRPEEERTGSATEKEGIETETKEESTRTEEEERTGAKTDKEKTGFKTEEEKTGAKTEREKSTKTEEKMTSSKTDKERTEAETEIDKTERGKGTKTEKEMTAAEADQEQTEPEPEKGGTEAELEKVRIETETRQSVE